MPAPSPWVTDERSALLTDLYELTMLQAYWARDMREDAVFSLFARSLPRSRSFLLACGLDDALRYLETLRFSAESLEFLRRRPELSREFVDWLEGFRFTGSVRAVPEGTPVFQNEPLLEVRAPIPEAQLAETFLVNQIHLQTLLASKAARVVQAAGGRNVVDFGLRRMHGTDAGMKAARAFYIAGVDATSNVLAGLVYGIPISGTMAHSYIQAHDDEIAAFRAFADQYPETVLLVDTYDTLTGVAKVVELARELGDAFRVRAVRLDSGDLGTLATEARHLLDSAGLERVRIFASGGLDEHRIAGLIRRGAPIDGFGVGTRLGVSEDAPYLDMAYKLVEYAGRDRWKLSKSKELLPGAKQIFRVEEGDRAIRDLLGARDEQLPGRPLLVPVMEQGRRLPSGTEALAAARRRAQAELARLPERLRSLDPAEPPYPVELSAHLSRRRAQLTA